MDVQTTYYNKFQISKLLRGANIPHSPHRLPEKLAKARIIPIKARWGAGTTELYEAAAIHAFIASRKGLNPSRKNELAAISQQIDELRNLVQTLVDVWQPSIQTESTHGTQPQQTAPNS